MIRTAMGSLLAVVFLASASVMAASPQAIHYQGYLTDADGNPLDDTVEMEFRLYDVEVAGEAFWTNPEAIAVDVENGVFRVNLAPVTAEQFASGDVWLGITVIPADPGEPAQEMEPRLKVLSVPYALVAEHAATADVAGEAAAVTNIDFSTFATGDDVQGVLGLCIQEADLTEALSGYCAAPCYGDAEVELFVTENGYVTFDALAQWVADNVETGPDEDALAAYLAANGYMTEADLLWFLGEAGYPAADDVVLRDGTKSLEGDWDVGGNQLLNLVIHNAASETPPEEPNAGQLWWDTTDKLVKVFNGEDWKTVGGGDVAFASDCDTIDGLDSSAFEPAGAVAAHEAAYGHLSAGQLATLTGGPESNADALHTHESPGGGLPNVNPDMLNSVFKKTYCSTDTPTEAPTDFGQVVSSIDFADAGAIISCTLDVEISHSAPENLDLTLSSPQVELSVSDTFQLDGTGDWTVDIGEQVAGTESAGTWTLNILDANGNDGKMTLSSWCVTIEYLSSDTLAVGGELLIDDSPALTDEDPGETVEFSIAKSLTNAMNNQKLAAEAGVDIISPDNFAFDLFSSRSAQYASFMVYEQQLGAYVCLDTTNVYYVVIEAETISDPTDFELYSCEMYPMEPGKWLLVSRQSPDFQINRARVLKTLFFGSSPRAKPCGEDEPTCVEYITGLSALKTSHESDVGLGAHSAQVSCTSGHSRWCRFTASFEDTSSNPQVQSWSIVFGAGGGGIRWEIPEGATKNSATGQCGSTAVNSSDETEKDTTGDITANPSTAQIEMWTHCDYSRSNGASVFLLANGGVSWNMTNGGNPPGPASGTAIDFTNDLGVPVFELANESPLFCALVSSPWPLDGVEKHAMVETTSVLWPDTNLKAYVSFDDGAHWTQADKGDWVSVSPGGGTQLRIKIELTRAVSQTSDAVYDFGIFYK